MIGATKRTWVPLRRGKSWGATRTSGTQQGFRRFGATGRLACQDDQCLFGGVCELEKASTAAQCGAVPWPSTTDGLVQPWIGQKWRMTTVRWGRGRQLRVSKEVYTCVGRALICWGQRREESGLAATVSKQRTRGRVKLKTWFVGSMHAKVSPVLPKTLQMAWVLLSKAAGSALSYDARLIPNELPESASIALEDKIRQAAAAMFGISENEQANQRMRLMGGEEGGGFGRMWLAYRLSWAGGGCNIVEHVGDDAGTCTPGRCKFGTACPDPGQRSVEVLGLPKVARHFPQKNNKQTVFLLSTAPWCSKRCFFPGSPLEGLEVGDTKPSLADCFEKCEGCCVCQCGSTTLQFMILVFTSSSASSTLARQPPMCNRTIRGPCAIPPLTRWSLRLRDSLVRLMASSDEILCASEDECLHPRRRKRYKARSEGAILRCSVVTGFNWICAVSARSPVRRRCSRNAVAVGRTPWYKEWSSGIGGLRRWRCGSTTKTIVCQVTFRSAWW